MSFNPNEPHNDLPLLPPKAELETKAVLKKAIRANQLLDMLKAPDGRSLNVRAAWFMDDHSEVPRFITAHSLKRRRS